jgi:putative spermidine/putrescine transport system permease protein
MTWLLHTPLTKTLPVGLADAYASMRIEIGSAYTLIFFMLIVPLLIGLQLVTRLRQRPEWVVEGVEASASSAARPSVSEGLS